MARKNLRQRFARLTRRRRAAPRPAPRPAPRKNKLTVEKASRAVAALSGLALLLKNVDWAGAWNAGKAGNLGGAMTHAATSLRQIPAGDYFGAMVPSIAAEFAIGAKRMIKKLPKLLGA